MILHVPFSNWWVPLSIAVEWRDIEAAQCLVSSAIKCGFRESGITSADGKRFIEWGFYKNGGSMKTANGFVEFTVLENGEQQQGDDDQLERTENGDAAVAAGSNIYVFGRLNNDTILSSLHVLNTRKKALVYMVTSAFHTNRNKHLFGNNKIKF
uniref:tRNA(Phe) 7-[(3-amino-3-carboxypropyl)-4-demethylwyosine(37)-N(4)]-methyltransferase n=1 Tax=Populus trichocarpa TaxID=3694 RepID=A0A2K1R7Z3_POPTR